jgi:Protein of unknown function (DUF1569)
MAVDTKHVSGRRTLHFNNHEEVLDEARSLSGKPVRQLGNWSLGQICEHLAVATNSAIDGAAFKPSLVVRLVGPFLKKRFMKGPLNPGFQLPKNGAAMIPGPTETAAGIAALEQAVERLKREPTRKPHGVFGPMTADEWDQILLRHAEMHMSFIVPEE